MGDVFDAMNRSSKEDTSDQTEAVMTPIGQDCDDQPALPLSDIKAAPIYHGKNEDVGALDLSPSANVGKQTKTTIKYDTDSPQTENQSVNMDQYAPHSVNKDLKFSNDIIVHNDRGSSVTEQYRAVRTQILARSRAKKLQVHSITSSAPNEGKSVSTINLGVVFAELKNKKILLVECDLRRPTFKKLFKTDPKPGLLQILRGDEQDYSKAIYDTPYPNLQFLPAGGYDYTTSTELLSSPNMTKFLDRMRSQYDHIFIDTPPVVTVTDACIVGAQSDETILVVRLNKTPTEVVDRAKRLLRAADCNVSGCILTHMKHHIPKYLYRYV